MLTDSQVRAAKPKDKAFKLTDGGGLYLQVTPSGGKHWRWRYEIEGKEKTYTIGSYPDVRLPGLATVLCRCTEHFMLASGEVRNDGSDTHRRISP